jgi:hypothetical protein
MRAEKIIPAEPTFGSTVEEQAEWIIFQLCEALRPNARTVAHWSIDAIRKLRGYTPDEELLVRRIFAFLKKLGQARHCLALAGLRGSFAKRCQIEKGLHRLAREEVRAALIECGEIDRLAASDGYRNAAAYEKLARRIGEEQR